MSTAKRVLVLVALGMVDDKWGLDALTKLTGQVFATGLMVLFGVVLAVVILPSGEKLSSTSRRI